MATRTFVADGTSRNWSANTSWVEGTAPTAADDVVFSTNVASSILVVDGTSGSPNLCRSFDTTNYTKTITMASAKQINIGDGTTGAFKLTAGMTFVPNGASVFKFVSTTTGNNITWAGYSPGNVTFDGVGGAWQLQDAPGTANTATWTLTNGSLDTNGKNITAIFSSNNSNTRSLTLGATNWNVGTFNGTGWDITTPTGMTLSAASSTITWPPTSGTSIAFNGGGLTYGTLTCTTLTTGTAAITGANTFSTLTLSCANATPTTVSGYKFSADQTVSGTFTSNGFDLIARNFLFSSTLGTARTISAGTFTITNTDLRDITKAGSGSGNISTTSSTSGNGDAGGNTGWTFQGTRSVYMKTAVSANWSGNNWKTTSGGSTAAVPPVPLLQDTAIFDANSVTAGSKTITVDMPRLSSMNWTGVLNTPAFAVGSSVFEVYGSWITVSGMTNTGTGTSTLMGRSAYTLTTGVAMPTGVTLNAVGGTYTLGTNFSNSSGPWSNVAGTLALGGFNFTVSTISITGGTVSGTGAITGTTHTQSGGTLTLGGTMTLNSTFALSGGTLDMNSNQITGHTTATISSTGTLNLSGQLNGSSTVSVTGGTITDSGASGELKGTTMSFSGGTSTIRKMTASSTFAISSTASLAFNPGTSTWVTSFTETGTTHSLTYNGTATNINGTLTVRGISGVFG